MRSIIQITKFAGSKLQEIAKKNNTDSLLFYVKGGGCNGFNYKFKPLTEPPNKLDEVVPYEDIKVVVCGVTPSTSLFSRAYFFYSCIYCKC